MKDKISDILNQNVLSDIEHDHHMDGIGRGLKKPRLFFMDDYAHYKDDVEEAQKAIILAHAIPPAYFDRVKEAARALGGCGATLINGVYEMLKESGARLIDDQFYLEPKGFLDLSRPMKIFQEWTFISTCYHPTYEQFCLYLFIHPSVLHAACVAIRMKQMPPTSPDTSQAWRRNTFVVPVEAWLNCLKNQSR